MAGRTLIAPLAIRLKSSNQASSLCADVELGRRRARAWRAVAPGVDILAEQAGENTFAPGTRSAGRVTGSS
jgi:hypothetical protein